MSTVTRAQIRQAAEALGLPRGDPVLIHSSFKTDKTGRPKEETARKYNLLCQFLYYFCAPKSIPVCFLLSILLLHFLLQPVLLFRFLS